LTKKITGYSVYSKKAKALKKVNDLPNFFPPLPNKKYDIIYADPPWHYNGKMMSGELSTGLGFEMITKLTKNWSLTGTASGSFSAILPMPRN
jgi:16S rRNA G966 N2-methylase RsmD